MDKVIRMGCNQLYKPFSYYLGCKIPYNNTLIMDSIVVFILQIKFLKVHQKHRESIFYNLDHKRNKLMKQIQLEGLLLRQQ